MNCAARRSIDVQEASANLADTGPREGDSLTDRHALGRQSAGSSVASGIRKLRESKLKLPPLTFVLKPLTSEASLLKGSLLHRVLSLRGASFLWARRLRGAPNPGGQQDQDPKLPKFWRVRRVNVYVEVALALNLDDVCVTLIRLVRVLR